VAANRKSFGLDSATGDEAAAAPPEVASPSGRGRFEAKWTRSASAGLWERRRFTRIKVVEDIFFGKLEGSCKNKFETKQSKLSSSSSSRVNRRVNRMVTPVE
jgi:hypothetical protein